MAPPIFAQSSVGPSNLDRFLSSIYQKDDRCLKRLEAVTQKVLSPGEAIEELFGDGSQDKLLHFFVALLESARGEVHEVATQIVEGLMRNDLNVSEARELIVNLEREKDNEGQSNKPIGSTTKTAV